MTDAAIFILCGKNKFKVNNVKAINLYKSNVFPILRKNNHHNIDIFILSAKYGVISENEIISYYDEFMDEERFMLMKDKMRQTIIEILQKQYKQIFVIAGGYYKMLFKDIDELRIIFCPFLRSKKLLKEFMLKYNLQQQMITDYK